MSVISAILTKDFIVVSSDSILNFEVDGIKVIDDDSYTKPKFVSFPKLQCVVSYWGLAYIKIQDEKVWQTYEWLKSKVAVQDKFENVESLGNELKADLENVFDTHKLRNPIEYGIGIHLTCFETFGNNIIPELFLLSNFKSQQYNAVGTLSLSRRTYIDLSENQILHKSLEEQRKIYFDILNQGKFSFYNNGDPEVFNVFANAYHSSVLIAKRRGKLKGSLDKEFYKRLASKPITQVSKFQKEYYVKGGVIVEGKTHTILMTKEGVVESA